MIGRRVQVKRASFNRVLEGRCGAIKAIGSDRDTTGLILVKMDSEYLPFSLIVDAATRAAAMGRTDYESRDAWFDPEDLEYISC